MYKSRERLSSFFLPGISQPPGQVNKVVNKHRPDYDLSSSGLIPS